MHIIAFEIFARFLYSTQSVLRRKLLCQAAAADDVIAMLPETLYADENATLSSAPAPVISSDCFRYDFCFRRILVYYGVVLLSPTGTVTVLVLVLLITSPPTGVKLPAMLASVTICCIIAQFCCTLNAIRTLPVVGKTAIVNVCIVC